MLRAAPTRSATGAPLALELTGAVVLAFVAALQTGCSSEPEAPSWDERVLEGQRFQDRGDYDRAEERYRQLLEEADDEEDRRYVQLQLARVAADRGNYDDAIARYTEVWSDAEEGSIPARAMYEASQLHREHLDAPGRSRELRTQIVRQFSGTTWAERSVESLAERYREREDWRGLRRDFDEMYEEVRDTPVAEDILYTVGNILNRDAENPDAALEYYQRLLENHPAGDLVDDTEWEAAQIHLRRQHWDAAIPLLRSLAEKVQASAWVGTYNSPHASKARYRLGFIHLTHLDDYRKGIEHFRTYLDDFPDNRRADDAAWHIAQAYRLLGDSENHRRALRRLVEDYPESRYARRARDQLDGTGQR